MFYFLFTAFYDAINYQPQYQKKTAGKRSPLRPLPKTSSNGMSDGEKALINHFDNQSYMSDTVN